MTKESQALRQPMIDRVNKVIYDAFFWITAPELQPNATIFPDLGLDDLEFNELAIKIDVEFNISIPWRDWDDVKTLAHLYKLVEQNVDMNQEADNEATNARR